jgi:hypothetical protein
MVKSMKRQLNGLSLQRIWTPMSEAVPPRFSSVWAVDRWFGVRGRFEKSGPKTPGIVSELSRLRGCLL